MLYPSLMSYLARVEFVLLFHLNTFEKDRGNSKDG